MHDGAGSQQFVYRRFAALVPDLLKPSRISALFSADMSSSSVRYTLVPVIAPNQCHCAIRWEDFRRGANRRHGPLTAGAVRGTTTVCTHDLTRRKMLLVFAALGLGASSMSSYIHYKLLTNSSYTSLCDVNPALSCSEA